MKLGTSVTLIPHREPFLLPSHLIETSAMPKPRHTNLVGSSDMIIEKTVQVAALRVEHSTVAPGTSHLAGFLDDLGSIAAAVVTRTHQL